LLARRVEQPLGRQDALEVFDPGQQFAQAHQLGGVGHEGQFTPLGIEARSGMDHQVGAVVQGQPVEGLGVDGDLQRHVDVGVAQGQEDQLVPAPQVQHLALDPDRRHPRHIVGHLRRQMTHRPGA